MKQKKTVVLGASANPGRYSYLAVNRLLTYNHPVVAIGRRVGKIDEVDIITEHPDEKDVDTVTLYLNPTNQKPYYNYILSLNPKRIIFNPGTENDELMELARENEIETIEGCTLIMLGSGQY